MFKGYYTALVTPFTSSGEIDFNGLEKLVERQIHLGIQGIVCAGTTAETPTLTHEEHREIIKTIINIADKRIHIIAGTGSNCTQEVIDLMNYAHKAGADAGLIVTPYYNKPTQEGLYQHFNMIQEKCDLPFLLYNVPSRCVVDLSDDLVERLSHFDKIIGIKDAQSDLVRPVTTRINCGENFNQLSGEDALVVPFLAQGGHGAISVTSNVVPDLCVNLYQAWCEGKWDVVNELNEKLLPLHRAIFCETSPAPVKYALSLMGLCDAHVRLPLCEIADQSKNKVRSALEKLGLI